MINANTSVYCIIGNPVGHSFSPLIHNTGFRELGINSAYVAYKVDNLSAALQGIRALGIKGASVTIPFKIDVIPLLDEIDDIGMMIGSVNTIVNRNGKLWGSNTDAYGFYKALKDVSNIENKQIAMFGSGGVARAIGIALFYYDKPKKLSIVIRKDDEQAAKDLRSNIMEKLKVKDESIEIYLLKDWPDIKNEYDILINSTPLGMYPDINSCVIDAKDFPSGSTVLDVVFNPHETRFVQNAMKNNCAVAYGIDMLLYQGIQQFELWTGQKAPVDSMKLALTKHLYT